MPCAGMPNNFPAFSLRRVLLHGAAFLLLGPRAAYSADPFEAMDPYVREAMREWDVPGLAVAVVKDGEIALARGYGVCEIGTDRPVTKDTVFSIASCTKSFTAACIGMLAREVPGQRRQVGP